MRYKGKVVYMYAFDVAYEMIRTPVRQLLGQPVAQFSMDLSKRSPRHLFFFRPQMVRLPPLERFGPKGAVRVERTVKILPAGAISITAHVPFDVEKIEDLVELHDLRFTNGSLHEEIKALAYEVSQELRSYYIKPVDSLPDEEAYTVFCLESPLLDSSGAGLTSERWLRQNRRQVASLLTQEPDVEQLSEQEAEESTGKFLAYYENDLVVIDWDAALLVDEPRDFEETLHIMELANLQLAELEAYDRVLDEVLERSYRDLRASNIRGRGNVLNDLREIRIDLARFSDEMSNITKFFGDWHLARIYVNISARFHLGDWHHSIDEKLKTLDNLYQIFKQDQHTRLMLILEVTIVLLFVIDVVMLFWVKK